MSSTKIVQNKIFEKLKLKFSEEVVEKEWPVAKGSNDDFTQKLYCPRVDIAVGPFNIDRVGNGRKRIDDTISKNEKFIERIKYKDDANRNFRLSNKNPRFFIAIEIEKSGSRKTLLGDIVNVSILGAIGIIIPLDDKYKPFIKIKNYIDFAVEHRKISYPLFENVIIIKEEDFLDALTAREK